MFRHELEVDTMTTEAGENINQSSQVHARNKLQITYMMHVSAKSEMSSRGVPLRARFPFLQILNFKQASAKPKERG